MKFIITILTSLCVTFLFGQEINLIQFKVSTPKIQSTDAEVFKNLENGIRDFFNNTKWTNDGYEQHERIKTNIQINVTEEVDNKTFRADFAISASRPVFGTSYETALITHVDKGVVFEYEQFQPIEKSTNTYYDNLSSVLSYYAYIILGLDYDSFEEYGGEDHFQTAINIVNTIPPNIASRDNGWRSVDGSRNKYWLIENILSPRVRPLRQASYRYHRQGLDLMANDTDKGKVVMLAAVEDVRAVDLDYPNSFIIQVFANTKGDEIVEVFKESTSSQKNKVYQIMSKLDPSNLNKYRRLVR